jgi:hypothetical protein
MGAIDKNENYDFNNHCMDGLTIELIGSPRIEKEFGSDKFSREFFGTPLGDVERCSQVWPEAEEADSELAGLGAWRGENAKWGPEQASFYGGGSGPYKLFGADDASGTQTPAQSDRPDEPTVHTCMHDDVAWHGCPQHAHGNIINDRTMHIVRHAVIPWRQSSVVAWNYVKNWIQKKLDTRIRAEKVLRDRYNKPEATVGIDGPNNIVKYLEVPATALPTSGASTMYDKIYGEID